ncbi:MAG TPA: RNA 2',3'-cyclic phosphodiesterase [Thermoplasmata archaeon]|nr:RNA 2',3'-cyclic phosphodiesterase [Thermoplasmata archaeon]
MTRTFVAIPIPFLDPSRPRVEASGSHLTLRFLGEVPEAALPELERAIARELDGRPGFDFVLSRMGAFPSRDRPRVVIREVADGAEELRDLARRVGVAAVDVGFPGDARPFVPHVTVMRVRSGRDVARARSILDGPPPAERSIEVTEVRLMASRLTPQGPEHEVRARFALPRARG